MSKEKLSAAELQLLLNHYQRRLKKTGKKMVSLEKKQAKLRSKIEKLFLLKSEKENEEVATETTEATESKPVIVQEAKPAAMPEKQVKKTETVVETPKEEKKLPAPVVEKTKEVAVSSSGIKRPKSPAEWNEYVVSVIARNERPTLTREIYEAASVDFSFSEVEMLMEERSIAKSLNVLSSKTGDLRKFKEGKMRGFFYCLPNWFYSSGEMKKMYYKRIQRNDED